MKSLKSISALFLALVLIFSAIPLSAGAEDDVEIVYGGILDDDFNSGLEWSIDANGTLIIDPRDTKGIQNHYPRDPFPWEEHKELIKQIIFKEDMVAIPDAFQFCPNLTTVTVLKSTYRMVIDDYAFYGCPNLKKIYIYEGWNHANIQYYAMVNRIDFESIQDKSIYPEAYVLKLGSRTACYPKAEATVYLGESCQLINGKTYVPLRAAAAMAGVNDLAYNSQTGTITYSGLELEYDVFFQMTVGSNRCHIIPKAEGGIDFYELCNAPVMKNGTVLTAIRDIAVTTGACIQYKGNYIVISPDSISNTDADNCIKAYDNLIGN